MPTDDATPPKRPSEMTDAEFATAKRLRAWRGDATAPSAALPHTSAAPSNSTSSAAVAPLPKQPSAKPALDMTDAEFAHAKNARAWR